MFINIKPKRPKEEVAGGARAGGGSTEAKRRRVRMRMRADKTRANKRNVKRIRWWDGRTDDSNAEPSDNERE